MSGPLCVLRASWAVDWRTSRGALAGRYTFAKIFTLLTFPPDDAQQVRTHTGQLLAWAVHTVATAGLLRRCIGISCLGMSGAGCGCDRALTSGSRCTATYRCASVARVDDGL